MFRSRSSCFRFGFVHRLDLCTQDLKPQYMGFLYLSIYIYNYVYIYIHTNIYIDIDIKPKKIERQVQLITILVGFYQIHPNSIFLGLLRSYVYIKNWIGLVSHFKLRCSAIPGSQRKSPGLSL